MQEWEIRNTNSPQLLHTEPTQQAKEDDEGNVGHLISDRYNGQNKST